MPTNPEARSSPEREQRDTLSTPLETIRAALLSVQRRIGTTVWNVPDGNEFIRFNAADVAEALDVVSALSPRGLERP